MIQQPQPHSQQSAIWTSMAMAFEGVLLLDFQGKILDCNLFAEQILRIDRTQLLGRKLTTYLQPPDTSPPGAIFATKNALPWPIEQQCVASRRTHDAALTVDLMINAMRIDEQAVYIVHLREHTEDQNHVSLPQPTPAVAASVATTTPLATIVAAIADAVIVVDHEGRITRMNPVAEDLMADIMPPDILALSALERSQHMVIYDDNEQRIAPEETPMLRIIQGEHISGIDIHLETRAGNTVFLTMSGTPLYDAQGQITGAVVVFHDVTERRQLERRTRSALEAVVELAHALVLPDAPEANPQRASQAILLRLITTTLHVLGCQRVEIAINDDATADDAITIASARADQAAQWREARRNSCLGIDLPPDLMWRLATDEPLLIDLTKPPFHECANPCGVRVMAVVPMRVNAELVGTLGFDYGGSDHDYTSDELALAAAVAHLVALVIERERLINEREAARAEALALAEANRRMDAFLNLAGHEMRTPLTHFKGGVQLALRRLDRLCTQTRTTGRAITPDELQTIQAVLLQTERQTSRMKRLVQDLLEVSRLQLDTFEIYVNECDCRTIVRQAVESQQLAYGERAISLTMPDIPIMVAADATRIEQVVLNYLANAHKFAPLDTPISVTLTHTATTAHLAVQDAGPGVPKASQHQIWERGYRVAGTDVISGSDIGLGLGLYLVRSLVERHQGHVGIISEAGHGATFWFTLPIAATPVTGG